MKRTMRSPMHVAIIGTLACLAGGAASADRAGSRFNGVDRPCDACWTFASGSGGW